MAAMTDIDTIIAGAAADTGFDPQIARTVLAAALGLLDKHGNREAMERIYHEIDGARLLASSLEAKPKAGGGLFGGVMRNAGGLSGKAMSDAMGVFASLKEQGIGKKHLKRVLPAARERVLAGTGRDLFGEAVQSVPGIGALLQGA